MHKTLWFILVVGGSGAAFAQAPEPMPLQRDAHAEMTSAQKRMELRNVLSAERRAEPSAQVDPAEPAGRQLSLQERAEMREQLRRYQPPGASRAQRP